MEILKSFEGNKSNVWIAAREFAHLRTNLKEPGEERLSFSVRHQVGWRIWITVVHTGIKAEILMAIAEGNSRRGSAKYLSGPAWVCAAIIAAAVEQVGVVFENASFYQRRAILMEAGKVCHELITLWDGSCSEDSGSEEGSHEYRIRVDEYEALLDVEWIEEMMHSKEGPFNG